MSIDSQSDRRYRIDAVAWMRNFSTPNLAALQNIPSVLSGAVAADCCI